MRIPSNNPLLYEVLCILKTKRLKKKENNINKSILYSMVIRL